jgi:hypothetical protein
MGLKLAACVRDRWPPIHIIITRGNARPREIPANVLFIPKPYVGRRVIEALRAFENIVASHAETGIHLAHCSPRFHFPGLSSGTDWAPLL